MVAAAACRYVGSPLPDLRPPLHSTRTPTPQPELHTSLVLSRSPQPRLQLNDIGECNIAPDPTHPTIVIINPTDSAGLLGNPIQPGNSSVARNSPSLFLELWAVKTRGGLTNKSQVTLGPGFGSGPI